MNRRALRVGIIAALALDVPSGTEDNKAQIAQYFKGTSLNPLLRVG